MAGSTYAPANSSKMRLQNAEAFSTIQQFRHPFYFFSAGRLHPDYSQKHGKVNSKTVVLEEICPVEGEPGSRLLVKQSQPIHDLPAGSPLLLPGERGLKEPTGTEKHDKGRRKSNKELEDFHGSQVLDGRPVASDGQNQGGACGCRGQMELLLPFLTASSCTREAHARLYPNPPEVCDPTAFYRYKASSLFCCVFLTSDLPVFHNLNYFKSYLSWVPGWLSP
ncbi:uncharacterized protein LOC123792676 isoform X2 [Ursus americanus]|uniref:uncharacterized protein LOC123792676 isoform X2 n=1 Tax=Ursus americanus TaxID=9643 RepID=UPI001E67D641|nr:uncharacterized protein LOC123792676 isoform X2 [Ursus americanus]